MSTPGSPQLKRAISTTNHETDDVCASCGITEGDDVKLKKCTACKLVRYCSIACQKDHRPQHKRACRRRATELREELLFKQPEISHLGECPLCFLPLPLDRAKSSFQTCCSKVVCNGCRYANELREKEEWLESKCPFCRAPTPKTDAGIDKYLLKRVEANDPDAIFEMGLIHYNKKKYIQAFNQWTKAAELGNVGAHYYLGLLYMEGEGVEKDEKKERFHLEEATIGGHPEARYSLGVYEARMGRIGKGVKHFIIGANLGQDESVGKLKQCFELELKEGITGGFVKKEDLASALRAHNAAVDATKSPQREAAERYYDDDKWNYER